MGSDELGAIKLLVIEKLARRRVYGSNHKSLDTVKRMGWKPHERGLVEKAVLELIREGRLRWYDLSREALQLADQAEDEYETRAE
jgi:hypothetical protein